MILWWIKYYGKKTM